MAAHKKYLVFFDTNCLRGEYWIADGISEVLPKFLKQTPGISVNFLLPDVAKEEWIANYLKNVNINLGKFSTALDGLRTLEAPTVNVKLPTEQEIRDHATQYLLTLGFKIIATPYESIDMVKLIERAVRHVPPFKLRTDEGIKDAFIAETIFNYCKNNSSSSDEIIVACRDETLKEYIEVLFGSDNRVKIVSSVKQFDSQYQLDIEKLDSKLGEIAGLVFYNREDAQCVYYSASISDRVSRNYEANFPDVPNAKKYIDSLIDRPNTLLTYGDSSLAEWGRAKPTFHIGETNFIGRKQAKLFWKSTVFIKVKYEPSSQVIDLAHAGIVPITHTVTYQVEWSSKNVGFLSVQSPTVTSIRPTDEQAAKDLYISVSDSINVYDGLAAGQPEISGYKASGIKLHPVTISGMQRSGSMNPYGQTVGFNAANPDSSALNRLLGTKQKESIENFWKRTGYVDTEKDSTQ